MMGRIREGPSCVPACNDNNIERPIIILVVHKSTRQLPSGQHAHHKLITPRSHIVPWYSMSHSSLNVTRNHSLRLVTQRCFNVDARAIIARPSRLYHRVLHEVRMNMNHHLRSIELNRCNGGARGFRERTKAFLMSILCATISSIRISGKKRQENVVRI